MAKDLSGYSTHARAKVPPLKTIGDHLQAEIYRIEIDRQRGGIALQKLAGLIPRRPQRISSISTLTRLGRGKKS
jgi:hypothetical protein